MDDVDLRQLRSDVCHETADWLTHVGDLLWVSTAVSSDDAAAAIALVTQMIGQLGQEAADAYDRDRWYAATCLTRQIVEAHYLMAVFRDDPEQRSRWLHASSNALERSFRPGRMRKAGGFRPGEYKQHCRWGGHPNPSARWLLPNHAGSVASPAILIADLGQHLTEAVQLLQACVPTLGLPPDLPEPPGVIGRWRTEDPLSSRVVVTSFADPSAGRSATTN